MYITKIKLLPDDTATIDYQIDNETSIEKRSFEGKEKVTQDFKNAFIDTKNTFVEYLTKLKNDVARIKTLEVKFEYKANILKSVCYQVCYAPSDEVNTPVNITTPKLPIWNEKAKAGTYYVSGQDIDIINNVRKFAENYILGDTRTKQMKIEVVND